jgi:hypothetical protein
MITIAHRLGTGACSSRLCSLPWSQRRVAFELHEKRGGIYGNDLQIFGTHGHDRYSAGNRSAPVALRQATQSRHDRRSAEQLLALFIAMDLFDLVQWPAMAITVGAAAMVHQNAPGRGTKDSGCLYLATFFGHFGLSMIALTPWYCSRFAWPH